MKKNGIVQNPGRIASYFRMEWRILLAVTLSGIIYNVGLLAGPYFEGQLAGMLLDIFRKEKDFYDMVRLAAVYVAVVAAVQAARYLKRFYVRRFANHVNRNMKQVLYGNLIHHSKAELEQQNIGAVMTKAISDVDACAEGMRKFTTEIFDTGVALLGYVLMLFGYDWRLTLLSLIFPPISYWIAEKMKVVVQKSSAAAQESRGRLSAATLERVESASTYRVFGCEAQRDLAYEGHLTDYEKTAVRANIWVAAMPPLYQIISMASVLGILYFGGKNVNGTGWTQWDIAAFTTFLSCFTKLSVKSAKAAKLFNAVHKAEVSWKRIQPLMKPVREEREERTAKPEMLEVRDLGVSYSASGPLFEHLSFTAQPGQIIGVTGAVASGKSTFGRAFLSEFPYEGKISYGGKALSSMSPGEHWSVVGYLGHDPELMSGTIANNLLLGEERSPWPFLEAVCLDKEVSEMPDGCRTVVGNGGVRLSGGQQARLALARTLAHPRPVLILDDPFAALDRSTEKEIFRNLKTLAKDSIILLISHRLYLFPEMSQVIWMENGQASVGTHEKMMEANPSYRAIYRLQEGGDADEA